MMERLQIVLSFKSKRKQLLMSAASIFCLLSILWFIRNVFLPPNAVKLPVNIDMDPPARLQKDNTGRPINIPNHISYTDHPYQLAHQADTDNEGSSNQTTLSAVLIPIINFVVRSAFIDLRPRDGYSNSTVILAEASKEILKFGLIVSCGVDEIGAKIHKTKTLYFGWIESHFPNLTHEEIMITCYDLEAHDNSTAFVTYRPAPNSDKVITSTVRVSYLLTGERKESKNKVVVCTMCFGSTPHWFNEWLRYQKTLGVDLVQINVDDQCMNEIRNLRTFQQYSEDGFLKIQYYKTIFSSTQVFYHSQVLKYHDCLYRHQNSYEYALFLDMDDFFIPRISNESTMKYYLNTYLPEDNQAAVKFHWHNFFPDCGLTQPPENVKDGNITRILRIKEYSDSGNWKFGGRLSLMTSVRVHTPIEFIKGSKQVYEFDSSIAYVAHIKHNRLKKRLKKLPSSFDCLQKSLDIL